MPTQPYEMRHYPRHHAGMHHHPLGGGVGLMCHSHFYCAIETFGGARATSAAIHGSCPELLTSHSKKVFFEG